MNIRFLAQSKFFNGIHVKEDVILEKEFEVGKLNNLPKVRYFLYYLEENVRKEVMPHSEKIDIFKITDCQYESDYIYFTEYDDEIGTEGYALNIIKYNIVDHTSSKIISLKDNVELYPDRREIKIFVLDDSNLIIQRALPKVSENGLCTGFFNYSLFLFNFAKNKQIMINDENLVKNGIDFMIPYDEKSFILKTGFTLFSNNMHELLNKHEAAVESIYLINAQQFIGDLQLENPNLVINAIDQSFYDTTMIDAKIENDYLIYSKYNFNEREENLIFYDLNSKNVYTCVNKEITNKSMIDKCVIIDDAPFIYRRNALGTQFINVETNEEVINYPLSYKIDYVNNNIVVASSKKSGLFVKDKPKVNIFKFPGKKPILDENGEYIGAVSSNTETSYIFLK